MDPWAKICPGSTLNKGPPRQSMVKETPFGILKPAPEVIEHVVEDLEDRLKHYFNLYIKERKEREVEQDKNKLYEERLRQVFSQLDAKDKKLCELEHKIKDLYIHPENIKDTLDRIDLIYIHLDSLVQAFIGICTCATLNGLNKNIFTKIALEYLYPCRNLDSRLDALYSALYSLLLTSNTNEGFFGQSSTVPLEGFHVSISEVVFSNDEIDIPNKLAIGLRYDHEEAIKLMNVEVKNNVGLVKMDKQLSLPPKKPGKIPKFLIDIWFDESSALSATASVSLIDPILLENCGNWPLMVNNLKVGYVKVTVTPYPINARMPAERFKVAKEFAHVHKGAKPIVDPHLLLPPNTTLIPANSQNSDSKIINMPNKSIDDNLLDKKKEITHKQIVTIKVNESAGEVKVEKPSDAKVGKPTVGVDVSDEPVKDSTPFVPKRQAIRRPGLGRPMPKKPTPLPKSQPNDAPNKINSVLNINKNNEGEGILKTIIESQPEKVTSIDNNSNNSHSDKINEFGSTQLSNSDVALDKPKTSVSSDVLVESSHKPEFDKPVLIESKGEGETPNLPNITNTNVATNEMENASNNNAVLNVDANVKTEVEDDEPKYTTSPPKMIVQRKLSTKKSDVKSNTPKINEVTSDDNKLTKMKFSPKIQIKPKQILANMHPPSESQVKSDNDEHPLVKSKLIPLVPLVKPVLLVKKVPM